MDLLSFREELLHKTPIPNLFIHTNVLPTDKIQKLLDEGIFRDGDNIINLYDVIELKTVYLQMKWD